MALVLGLFMPMAADEPADLVLRGGVIQTCDRQDRHVTALAARGERLVAVGSDDEIRPLIGPATRVIDLKGRLAIPGFIEGHGHLMSLGSQRMQLDLSKARGWSEIVEQVAAAARTTPRGQWIRGRGWHQEKWRQPPRADGNHYPTHDALSRVTPDHPVLLVHGTGHMSVINARAIELARIDRNTPDPRGGKILRAADGSPTGVLQESAQGLAQSAYGRSVAGRSSAQIEADALRAIELATQECLAKGVTSFQDAGSLLSDVQRFRRLADEGKLGLRLWVMLRGSPSRLGPKLAETRMVDYGNHRLTVRAIKCMIDGALGSHGAWLLEPYDDLPDSTGLVLDSVEELRAMGLLALQHDYQLCTHAIGDRANREVLNLYDLLYRSHPEKKDPRWRIEHAQHLDPADIPRFAEIGVIASMQANHATSDGPFVVARLGTERARLGAYAWRSLLDAGATVINGTDVPVEDVDPILCYYSAVTRRMEDGRQFFPEQRMTRREALRSDTIDAAFAAFEDHDKGSLEPGKLADIVVLSQNILTIPDNAILRIKVDYTILDGRVVYERASQK